MIISITGGKPRLKNMAESMIRFAADLLMDKKLIRKLTVDLEFSRTLYKDDGMLAEIDFDDRIKKPREFTITVDNTVPMR
jgi:Ni,Fe-hydrogenase I small subunit